MKGNIWETIGTQQISNIISFLPFLCTVGIGLVNIFTHQSDASSKIIDKQIHHVMVGLFLFLLLATMISIILTIVKIKKYNKIKDNDEKYNIIKILCELQNKYILTPEFKTAVEHGDYSKEKNLTLNGTAQILTNSLEYDMLYCGSIAENIVNEAKYIYVIPKIFQTITELKTYIVTLYNELEGEIRRRSNSTGSSTTNFILDRIKEILRGRIEFWFFNKDVLCLYNFARFTQKGAVHQAFMQSWWYVNPNKDDVVKNMLSCEIDNPSDHQQLNEVFKALEDICQKVDGYTIFEKREELDEYYGN